MTTKQVFILVCLAVFALSAFGQSSYYAVGLGGGTYPIAYQGLGFTDGGATSGVSCSGGTPITTASGSDLLFKQALSGSAITCTFSVPAGVYTVAPYFRDWQSTAYGQRQMSVAVNGITNTTGFDVYGYAQNNPVNSQFQVTVSGSSISIVLTGTTGTAIVSAIRVKQIATVSGLTTTITSCGTQSTPVSFNVAGNYVLSPSVSYVADFTNHTPCVQFSGISSGQSTLDCKNARIVGAGSSSATTGINVVGTSNMTISSCTIIGASTPFQIIGGSNISLSGNVLSGYTPSASAGGYCEAVLSGTSGLSMYSNQSNDCLLLTESLNNAFIYENTFQFSSSMVQNSPFVPCKLWFTECLNCAAIGNVISTAVTTAYADSIVVFIDSIFSNFSRNAISGTGFTALEYVGNNQVQMLSPNTVSGTLAAMELTYPSGTIFDAFGDGHTIGLHDSTVNLIVDRTSFGILATCSNYLPSAGQTPFFSFSNNVITLNLGNNMKPLSSISHPLSIYGDSDWVRANDGIAGVVKCSMPSVVSGNVIKNSNMLSGSQYRNEGPLVEPGSGFTDGGGNSFWPYLTPDQGSGATPYPSDFPLTSIVTGPSSFTLIGNSGHGQVFLSWNLPASTFPISSYSVYRNGSSVATGLSAWTLNWYDSSPGSISNSYYISAIDTMGFATSSNTVSVGIQDTCPAYTGYAVQACFYNTNHFSGNVALVRTDTAINYSWGSSAPATGVNAYPNYSVNFFANMYLGTAPIFTFHYTGVTGVLIDGNPCGSALANATGTPTTQSSTCTITAGQHAIEIQYVPDALGVIQVTVKE